MYYKHRMVMLMVLLAVQLSCKKDPLSTRPLDRFSEDQVWSDAGLVEAYVSNTYRVMPHGFQFNTRRLFCLSDESKARGSASYSIVNAGNVTPSLLGPLDYWIGTTADPGYYQCITQCNVFLANTKESPVDAALKKRMTGEIRTLRAYAYFQLISLFGGVPLITEPFSLYDDFNVPRNSYDDCMNFVISELDEAAALLPPDYDAAGKGRLTQGAALAIKSRALLYAASALNNPGNDRAKWQKAADAAKAVIDLNRYQLFPEYKEMFQAAKAYNSEMIWVRPFNHIADPESVGIEQRCYPNGYNGFGQICPLQNLVEKYETINGRLPQDDPSFDPQNPYVNRDPRFYATILFDGAPFKGRNVETFLPGGRDSREGALSPWNASESGYYLRKYIDESITDPNTNNASDPPWPFFRYAEILLNYAEAAYHLGDEGTCRQYVNQVRSRPGVNMPPVTEGGAALLKRLQNERFIELAFEAHRYFDVRRWKIAPEVLDAPARGISIRKGADGKKTYSVSTMEERHFFPRNYLAPIPQSEIDKNPQLKQNPEY
jgi:hypothetical protein